MRGPAAKRLGVGGPPRAPLALVAAAAFATACSGGAPTPTIAAIDVGPPPPPLPQLVAARWIDASGATLIGPTIGSGTMVLLGGRRAFVDSSGVKVEAAPSPEALWDVVDVPVGDRHELVAAGARGVYRLGLDDPLGALTPIGHAAVAKIGAGNGGVYVWSRRSDVPTFVELGAPSGKKGVSFDEPLRAIAFRDARAGAAIFAVSGLAATTDGGATFRLVTGQRDEPVRANGLRRGKGGAIRAFVFSDGPDAEVDVEHGKLEPLARVAADPKEAPLLAWIRATGRDPLEVAASSGLDAPGGALVASHGLLAKVDLKSGALLEMTEFARGKWMNPCSAARAAQTAYIACPLSDGATDMFDPFGVLRVRLDEGPLKVDKPIVVRNGEADLRSSPSGGAMLLGACSPDEDAIACVKQPDGKWLGVKGDVELAEHGAGPLADGRVAIVRGASEVEPEAPDDDLGKGHRLRVAAIDRDGKEKTIALVGWEGPPVDLRISSPIEEDESRALHFVLNAGDTPYVVIASPGKEPAPARRLASATFAKIHGGRGVALGDAVQTSLDGGASWTPLDLPPRIADVIAHSDGPVEEVTQVSEVGFRVGNALRVGWGPAEATSDPPARDGPALAEAPLVKRGPEQILRCESQGPAQSTPPPLGGPELKDSLATTTKPKDGVRREVSSWSGSRWGMLDTVAVFEVESRVSPDAAHPDAAPGKPAPLSWSFRWLQPTAIGDRVHVATMPPPKVGATSVTGLRSANASGNRALFTVRLAGDRATDPRSGSVDKHVVVRARAGAPAESRELPQELIPIAASDVVFGEGKGEPIVWLHDTSLVVWFSGEAPRVAAELSIHGTRHLGEPTSEGVPLLVGGDGWTLFRVVPIADKSPARVPLQGWTKLAFAVNDAGDLAACPAHPKGARVFVSRPRGSVEIDGTAQVASSTVLELRVSGADACVASVASLLVPGAHRPGPGEANKNVAGFASFVRAEIGSGVGEGGDRGPPTAAKIRRLRCKLSP